MANIIKGVEFKKLNRTSTDFSFNGTVIRATKDGLRLKGIENRSTNRLPVEDAASVLALLDKGTARKFRKALRAAGYKAHAAARKAS